MAGILQYASGIATAAKCYFLPNLHSLLSISNAFIHFTHTKREAKDCSSACSLAYQRKPNKKKGNGAFTVLFHTLTAEKGKYCPAVELTCNIPSPWSEREQPKSEV